MEEDKLSHKNSLALKCFKIIFTTYFAFNLIITGLQIYADFVSAKDDVIKEIEQFHKLFNKSTADALYSEDEVIVESIITGMNSSPLISGVKIIDDDDDLVKKIPSDIDKQGLFSVDFPIMLMDIDEGPQLVGYMNIYYSNMAAVEKVKMHVIILILFALIKSFILFSIFLWVIKRKLVKPLSSLASQAQSIKLENLQTVSLGLDKTDKNELNTLENSINFMVDNLKSSKVEIEDKVDKIEGLNDELNGLNQNLQTKVEERTEELNELLKKTETMLLNVHKAIFITDQRGMVQAPVSAYCEHLFEKNIVGENGLKLLFFHLKDSSTEKRLILEAWKNIFGGSETDFLFHQSDLPHKVIHPDKHKTQGRVLAIDYAPILGKNNTVEKIMFLVADITEEESENVEVQEKSQNFSMMMDVLPVQNKEDLSQWVSEFIKLCVFTLEKFVGPEAPEIKEEEVHKHLNLIFSLFEKGQFKDLKNLEMLISKSKFILDQEKGGTIHSLQMAAVNILTQFVETLIQYAEVLNILHSYNLGPGVGYELPDDFEDSLKEKVADIDRLMVNILEYVFLVRNVNDLDKEKIENAPKKARLYAEYDRITDLLMNRSLLISYLFKVVGKTKESKSYHNLSDLLKQMPSKDKLTEAALVNNLVDPYKNIKKDAA